MGRLGRISSQVVHRYRIANEFCRIFVSHNEPPEVARGRPHFNRLQFIVGGFDCFCWVASLFLQAVFTPFEHLLKNFFEILSILEG